MHIIERTQEQIDLIGDTPVPQEPLISEETTLNTSSTSTSSAPSIATPVLVIEHMAHAHEPSPEELTSLESLQHIIHEKQVEVDRCVRVLKRDTEKLRLLEKCSYVPPRDLEELRRANQASKDALAVPMRELHAFREQPGLWKRSRISNPDTPHP